MTSTSSARSLRPSTNRLALAAAIDRHDRALVRLDRLDRIWLASSSDARLDRLQRRANARYFAAADELAGLIMESGGRPMRRGGRVYRVDRCMDLEGDPSMLVVDRA